MKTRYRLICRGIRGGLYYCVDTTTGKRTSLGTTNEDEARQIIEAKNISLRQPVLNLQIAKAYLAGVRSGDRATEFGQRCRQLGIKGVTLHSYRYAWAERAKTAGYPERFAMENLGHNSKAVHRAYARRALVKIPSLEDYEQRSPLTATVVS